MKCVAVWLLLLLVVVEFAGEVHLVKCYSCGHYNNDMRPECKNATSGKIATCAKGCWVYRYEAGGSSTYARGCKSDSSLARSDTCEEFDVETCTVLGSYSVCRHCCTSDRCNSGRRNAFDNTFNILLTFTASLILVVNGLH